MFSRVPSNAPFVVLTILAVAGVCTSCGETPTDTASSRSTTTDTGAALSAEPTDWPIFRGSPGLRGVAAGSLPDQLELKWSFETGGAIASSPIVVDGRVYVGSDDGFVYCVDLEDGSEIWRFETEDILEAPPLYYDGVIYIGASDFYFYAINAQSGDLLWKQETNDTILGGANVIELEGKSPRIIVGSYDASLYCFDAKTGDLVWRYETLDRINGTPAVLDDRIVFGGCDSVLYIVDANSGLAVDSLELGEDCHIAGSVGIDNGTVYFGHYGNEFVAVDLDSVEVEWTYGNDRDPFFSAPAIGDLHVVFGGRDRKMHCVDRLTGEQLWEYQTRRKVDGSPIICDGKVVFGSGDGRLYMLDLATGDEIWTYDLGKPIFSSPAVVNGMIIIGCGDKKLHAFGTVS